MVHYHEEHPENHNVVNIKENIIKTLKGKNNWKMLDFESFVEKFAIEKYDQLCDLYNSDEINIDDVIREKFEDGPINSIIWNRTLAKSGRGRKISDYSR